MVARITACNDVITSMAMIESSVATQWQCDGNDPESSLRAPLFCTTPKS